MIIDDPIVRTLSVNGERRIAAFQLTGTVSTGVFVPPNAAVPAHYVLAGPESGTPALMTPRLLIPSDIEFAAILENPNVFGRENTFPALRVVPRLVTEDYEITQQDGEIVVNALAGSVMLTLPVSAGAGQDIRITRVDSTTNLVNILPQGSDVIANGLTAVPLGTFQTATLRGALIDFWELGMFIPPFTLPTDLALLDQPNFFTQPNSFPSLRLGRRIVSGSDAVVPTDFAIYIQGMTADIDLQLPQALVTNGRGQLLRFKILDDTPYIVRILTDTTNPDLIDGAASLSLVGQYAEAILFEADIGVWDSFGPDLSGFIAIPDTPPATPTTLNEVIALLQSYGLCA
jgi:hypothetical protein